MNACDDGIDGNPSDAEMTVRCELSQALLELELVSHVPAARSVEGGRSAEDGIGGKCPPGGLDRKEDAHRVPRAERSKDQDRPERVLRSPDHFKRRIKNAHSLRSLEAILEDAKAALVAWKIAPPISDQAHPMPGDYNWKRWVGESDLSAEEIARKCGPGVTGQYVRKIRQQYRDREAA